MRVEFVDAGARSFCNGGWLEGYVSRLLGELRREGVLQDSPPHQLTFRSLIFLYHHIPSLLHLLYTGTLVIGGHRRSNPAPTRMVTYILLFRAWLFQSGMVSDTALH